MDEHEDITPAAFREFNRSRTGSSSHSHGAPAPGLGPEPGPVPGPGLPSSSISEAQAVPPRSTIVRCIRTAAAITPVPVSAPRLCAAPPNAEIGVGIGIGIGRAPRRAHPVTMPACGAALRAGPAPSSRQACSHVLAATARFHEIHEAGDSDSGSEPCYDLEGVPVTGAAVARVRSIAVAAHAYLHAGPSKCLEDSEASTPSTPPDTARESVLNALQCDESAAGPCVPAAT